MPLTRHLRETFLKVWDGADLSGAFDSVTYAREEQIHHERRLRALVDSAISDFKTVRADRTREAEVQSRVLGSFSDFACSSLGWDAHLLRGPLADDFARALRADGSVIDGLYCVGNNSASVMGTTYPGPGCTIGPAMTFGYIAARHAAGVEGQ